MIKTGLLDPARTLPLVIESCAEEGGKSPEVNYLIDWYKNNESYVGEKLLEHGAILFRGFGVNSPAHFARLTRSVSRRLLESMEENVPRTKLSAGVYTTTEYPPQYRLSMHSEFSYSHHWPAKLFFCCIKAAKEGGETPLADNREVIKKLDGRIVEDVDRKQVKYLRNLHGGQGFGLSWQQAFQTSERAAVEDYCRNSQIQCEWKPNGTLKLSQTLPGIVMHPKTGDRVWFNQAPQFHPSDYPDEIYQSLISVYKDEGDLPQNVCFGDGTAMDSGDLNTVRETMFGASVIFPWREGDVVLLDNVLVSHGRMPFVGPRKTLVAMAAE